MGSTSKSGEECATELGLEIKMDEKDGCLNMELSDLVNLSGSIVNNFPVITGYYGIMLRKKRHPLFGTYWSKEYCLIQSNMFVCHKIKYPYCITKCISIASIVKCEISIIDPCVFCISVDNELKMENKSTNKKKSRTSVFFFGNKGSRKKLENIKFKCISTFDTQKWINYINNNIKTWKLNKNTSKNLFSSTNYIEKTVAQEMFERVSKKMRKIVYQSYIQSFSNLLKKLYLKQLYYSFSRLHLNYVLTDQGCKDDSSITTYKSNVTSTSDNELLYRNDLLQIKKRILTFKHEQGINNLNRIINRKKMNYWTNFVDNLSFEINNKNRNDNFTCLDSNTAGNPNNGDNYVDYYYNQVKLRRVYYRWKALTKKRGIFNSHIEILNNYKLRYENNNSSLVSTDYYPTHCTSSENKINFSNNSSCASQNCSPNILTSSITSEDVVSSNITSFTKHHVYCSEENVQNIIDVKSDRETKNTRISTKTSYNIVSSSILTNRGHISNKANHRNVVDSTGPCLSLKVQQDLQKKSEDKLAPACEKKTVENKKRVIQLIKLNQILLKKKRSAWGLLQANIIQNKVLFSIYKYNQILSFLQIADKIHKLRLYKAFIQIRSSGGNNQYGV
ncbi:hypothetical protein FG386_001180 [Cryptosporidium ryanae]|uniref:uncharacterized protein n=1 Tax=Cryptosporidium ryanae TaxID=515981 RepID=UPI00351A974C|nr:hypothetical protein FG386_001180 [Cryptosporidium ryanae]